jgi:hypothetical protein
MSSASRELTNKSSQLDLSERRAAKALARVKFGVMITMRSIRALCPVAGRKNPILSLFSALPHFLELVPTVSQNHEPNLLTVSFGDRSV